VAGWIAKLGKRVLVVDLDPQGNATAGLGIDRETVDCSIFDVLTGKANIQNSILETASGVHQFNNQVFVHGLGGFLQFCQSGIVARMLDLLIGLPCGFHGLGYFPLCARRPCPPQ
jgi:hypothetical protein